MSEVVSPSGKGEEQNEEKVRSRRMMRATGLILIIISVLSGWFLIVGYLGWQSGQRQLVQQRQAEMAQQIIRQVELAEADITAGNYNLAMRRLDWVLARDGQHERAQALRQQAQALLLAASTPSPTATSTPAVTPAPTETPGPLGSPESELQRIRRLLDAEAWPEAISAITNFQLAYPEYERPTTDRLLFDAYVNLGQELLPGTQVELGIYYLNQAERLGNLPQSVEDYRLWAELYLQGISFYGVNWGAAAYYFRDLCLAAPFYQSACQRLQEILIAYGDQYAFVEDWCPAVGLYEEATSHGANTQLNQKLFQARESCLLATPTPDTPLITDTLPLTRTEPFIGEPFILPTITPFWPAP